MFTQTPDYIDQNGDTFSDADLLEMYEDMLNDVYPALTIGNTVLDPADVLREMAPTDYRVGMVDYQDSLGWDEWNPDHEWIVTEDEED